MRSRERKRRSGLFCEGVRVCSQFRMMFDTATRQMNARCRLDSFSGSVMQIHKDDMVQFIDQLHCSLKDYYTETGSL